MSEPVFGILEVIEGPASALPEMFWEYDQSILTGDISTAGLLWFVDDLVGFEIGV
jgi:hypothetical protein